MKAFIYDPHGMCLVTNTVLSVSTRDHLANTKHAFQPNEKHSEKRAFWKTFSFHVLTFGLDLQKCTIL